MIKKTLLAAVSAVLLISCATVDAKQPVTAEAIEGYTAENAMPLPPEKKAPDESAQTSESETSQTVEKEPSIVIARQHQGPVLSLSAVSGTEDFFSAGRDGFVSFHTTNSFDETWQLSDLPIQIIAAHPKGTLIAIYETDGFSIHRISVWNWKTKERKYAKRFRDSVKALSWSAQGTYLMIGNTSIEGITVLEGSSGKHISVFKSPPGIVTLSGTGARETSMITFGPSGRIRYTDISNGNERGNYQGERDLDDPVLLGNSLKIAGYKDGEIIVLDATSGNFLQAYEADNPVMATATADNDPVWFEKTEIDEDFFWVLKQGSAVSQPFSVPDQTDITAGLSLGSQVIFGSESGKLYSVSSVIDTEEVPMISTLVYDQVQPIDDIASDNSRLFILSDGSVLISTGPGKSPVYAFSDVNANRISLMNGNLICWSSVRRAPITRISFDGDVRKELFQPRDAVTSFSIDQSKIVFIEGNSYAYIFDTLTEKVLFTYNGVGLQDAILISDTYLLISKSSSFNSPYPLLLINISTGETVPLPLQANLCFGITKAAARETTVYGFIITTSDSSSRTELIRIDIDLDTVHNSKIKTEAVYPDEDLTAVMLLDKDRIITNLGKSTLVEINPSAGKQYFIQRGYAMPKKSILMDQFLISINYDGSLTWYNRSNNRIFSTAAITGNRIWIEQ
ncbi:hypothetical protein K7I13_01030 [Brucepastera parasyntrophica]|uniref:hypothetical protein n=1 Tax=Brucepastera parasyntrophica TaxID=2880008 RepID=UPI002108C1F6|nr:hypothetical protein [Brucepastera parasyntrophica]ULQ59959.1 hypothetical protein K7I13_01030 [Brucepastera parasyntrophica]